RVRAVSGIRRADLPSVGGVRAQATGRPRSPRPRAREPSQVAPGARAAVRTARPARGRAAPATRGRRRRTAVVTPRALAASPVFSAGWLRNQGVVILVALAAAAALSLIARLGVGRVGKRMGERSGWAGAFGGKRVQTVTNSLLNVALAIIWAITVLVVLDQFGVSLAPLFAAAGIAGLAFGFGAQTLVRDGLSGFFILLENQFDLGDTIDALTTAGMISGRIEAFTFRVTSIRAFDGTLHYVPNGNIQVVSNKSKGWARAIV